MYRRTSLQSEIRPEGVITTDRTVTCVLEPRWSVYLGACTVVCRDLSIYHIKKRTAQASGESRCVPALANAMGCVVGEAA